MQVALFFLFLVVIVVIIAVGVIIIIESCLPTTRSDFFDIAQCGEFFVRVFVVHFVFDVQGITTQDGADRTNNVDISL